MFAEKYRLYNIPFNQTTICLQRNTGYRIFHSSRLQYVCRVVQVIQYFIPADYNMFVEEYRLNNIPFKQTTICLQRSTGYTIFHSSRLQYVCRGEQFIQYFIQADYNMFVEEYRLNNISFQQTTICVQRITCYTIFHSSRLQYVC